MRKQLSFSLLVCLVMGILSGGALAQPAENSKAYPIISLQKSPDRDFVILNLSDPQLKDEEWLPGADARRILTSTLEKLIGRVKPDLITITGDLAWAGQLKSYEALASYLDSFGIPWAPVWGNHDNQGGYGAVKAVADRYKKHAHCVFEAGDPKLGCGNYIIAIREQDKIVTALFMMDSHDRLPAPTPEKPDNAVWAKLLPEQLDWYRGGVDVVNKDGCKDSAIFLHIPIYAYREAAAKAYRGGVVQKELTFEKSKAPECWNPGFEGAIGFAHEDICSNPTEDGAFKAILEKRSTTHVICGHDHVNNFIIPYQGVKLVYSVKAGAGCYWEAGSNGGTVLTIGADGIKDVRQEFVVVE